MKVFLVDDEIVIREGIRESFPWEDTPYTLVGEAPDGEMALPMIRDTNPDIVITDIKMPFMDGLELCRVLRVQMPWVGIIVLSGYDEFEYARQCINLGVREYLLKPINAADLKEALDKVSKQITEERKQLEHASSLRARMGNDGKFVKEKLLGSLFTDEAMEEDAEGVLKQLASMGCNGSGINQHPYGFKQRECSCITRESRNETSRFGRDDGRYRGKSIFFCNLHGTGTGACGLRYHKDRNRRYR